MERQKRKTKKLDLSIPVLLGPYVILFLFFIVLPIVIAVILSFTYFNTVETPEFTGLGNYIAVLTQDEVFLKNVLPNTIKFSLIVGPVGPGPDPEGAKNDPGADLLFALHDHRGGDGSHLEDDFFRGSVWICKLYIDAPQFDR